jgi:bifunctional DNase/RNase
MNKIEMEIVALSGSVSQSSNFAVVLGEINGDRRLPVVIGNFEAQAIAVAIERLTSSRPLTHDLIKIVFDTFDIELKEVVINNLLDGIFFARLLCLKDGELIEIDCRTPDALALAARFECPIFTYDFILDAAGIVLEENADPPPRKKQRSSTAKSGLSSHSTGELEKRLEEALQTEDYEQAAKIRDELSKRQS